MPGVAIAAAGASSAAASSSSLLLAAAAASANYSDEGMSPEAELLASRICGGFFLTVFWLLSLMSPFVISQLVRCVWFRGRRRPATALDWTIPAWTLGMGGMIYTAISITILAYTVSEGYGFDKVALIMTMITAGYLGGNLGLIPILAAIAMWRANRKERRLDQRADVERGVATQAVRGSEAPPRYEAVELHNVAKA